jgi:hypothetical protein
MLIRRDLEFRQGSSITGITLEICRLLACVTANTNQPRRSAMKKLMTIAALAFTLISVTTFAASAGAVFEDAQHGAGEASQR